MFLEVFSVTSVTLRPGEQASARTGKAATSTVIDAVLKLCIYRSGPNENNDKSIPQPHDPHHPRRWPSPLMVILQ